MPNRLASSSLITMTCSRAGRHRAAPRPRAGIGIASRDRAFVGVCRLSMATLQSWASLNQQRADKIHIRIVVLVERVHFHERIEERQIVAACARSPAEHAVELADCRRRPWRRVRRASGRIEVAAEQAPFSSAGVDTDTSRSPRAGGAARRDCPQSIRSARAAAEIHDSPTARGRRPARSPASAAAWLADIAWRHQARQKRRQNCPEISHCTRRRQWFERQVAGVPLARLVGGGGLSLPRFSFCCALSAPFEIQIGAPTLSAQWHGTHADMCSSVSSSSRAHRLRRPWALPLTGLAPRTIERHKSPQCCRRSRRTAPCPERVPNIPGPARPVGRIA